jgi:hypothetical protein
VTKLNDAMNQWLRSARGVELDADDFFSEPHRLGTTDTGAGGGGKRRRDRPTMSDVIRGFKYGTSAEAAMQQRQRDQR